jgi:hypothetical protein
MKKSLLIALVIALALCFSKANAVPESMLNPEVNQSTILTTICQPYYTQLVRPNSHYTNAVKRLLLFKENLPLSDMKNYQLDHVIALTLGGSPSNHSNLAIHSFTGEYNVRMKDKLSIKLKKMVCNGEIPLHQAQDMMYPDWISTYKQFYVR